MASFDRNSNFNAEANFTGVKFGEAKPVLETELNELQEIQNEARAEIIRDTIPSGFVQLGDLDYDYMLNNENCVKLKSDSVAYVNGYKIKIPKDTIINIGKAPEKDAREDLVFLEVWKEEVNKDTILTKNGGEGQAQITNAIKDDRYPVETSRRYAIKWRLRHVPNIDFNANGFIDGFPVVTTYSNNVRPQGGNTSPLIEDTYDTRFINFSVNPEAMKTTSRGLKVPHSNIFYEPGLALSGTGDTNSKNTLKTLDGYVYAVPMFRLYRKPSCGKAIPFEYRKIHPKVDYSKFTSLMKEERVERVVSENIGGKSLVNYLDFSKLPSTYSYDKTTKILTTPSIDDTQWSNVNKSITGLKPNTTYSCIIKILDCPLSMQIREIGGSSDLAFLTNMSTVNTVRVLPFTTSSITELGFKAFDTSRSTAKKLQIMILEGDWTNKPLPNFFTSLKSLSEEEGNLVEVKTGILNESSYDPTTGTPKLSIVSGTNYITSDNLIVPTIEAQVKRGEVKLSDLTAFGKVDNLVGDEKVDFTKIKGRTLQNLAQRGVINTGGTSGVQISTNTADVLETTLTSSGSIVITNDAILKDNTTYTIVVDVRTTLSSFGISFYNGLSNFTISAKEVTTKELNTYNKYMVTLTTTTGCKSLVIGYHNSAPISTLLGIKKNILILEGDYTNTPFNDIPYITSIKSCGDYNDNKIVIKRHGINLFNHELPIATPNIVTRTDKEYRVNNQWGKIGNISLKNGSIYTISCEARTEGGESVWYDSSALFRLDSNYGTLPSGRNILVGNEGITLNGNYKKVKFTITTNLTFSVAEFSILVRNTPGNVINVRNIQIVEGSTDLSYEPYKEYKQEITLKEPLRSLPNGVCDYIEGDKVIRRVGKIVLNGSEDWRIDTTINSSYPNFIGSYVPSLPNRKATPDNTTASYLISDTCVIMSNNNFCYLTQDSQPLRSITGNNSTSIAYNTGVCIKLSKTLLSSADLSGFKTWLSQNPTTVYYELANPIEELIEPNYDKESIKTYQLDAPLRSLPNGVKDEIINNKIIRRCEELYLNNLDLNTLTVPSDQTDADRIYGYIQFNNLMKRQEVNLVCDKVASGVPVTSNASANLMLNEYITGYSGNVSGNWVYIKLLKSRLSSADKTGLQAWINENKPKIVYELANPIEIPLKEVHSNTANFTLQRQFSSGNWLRELPNGVKDTIENGKVIRRIKRLVIDGNDPTSILGASVNSSLCYLIPNVGLKNNGDNVVNVFASSIPSTTRDAMTSTFFGICSPQKTGGYPNGLTLVIEPTKLETSDLSGVKKWLNKNPITVLYELATPTEEALSTDNYMLYPCHEVNTYCGSLYVGNGTNDAFVNNELKNDGVVIDTNFRSIENKAIVTDCKYKKNVDGYDTNIVVNNGKNIFNILTDVFPSDVNKKPNIWGVCMSKDESIAESLVVSNNSITCGKASESYRGCYFAFKLKPNTNYCLSFLLSSGVRIQCRTSNNANEIYFTSGNNASINVATDSNGEGFIRVETSGVNGYFTMNNIQIEEGTIATTYEAFIRTERSFQNTEANDVEDLRHLVSLTGFNYEQILNESFDKLLRGEL